jgi:hypothetical protein
MPIAPYFAILERYFGRARFRNNKKAMWIMQNLANSLWYPNKGNQLNLIVVLLEICLLIVCLGIPHPY